ncbi:MAG: hypothetical protein H0X18_00700 [Geodermatophilaceae bacterium]|nr:hypothetical protein [Geodermatophilaceae bacterium]
MGSGLLLAILVALWFVVLVPMVVTRGDLATAPAESTRVLRRRSDRSAMPTSASSMNSMSHRVGSGSTGARSSSTVSSSAASPAAPETMLTSPIPPLPRRVPGATLVHDQPPVPGRPAGMAQAEQVAAGSEVRDRSARAELDIRTRRRRMLTGLVALAALWALFAIFWQPLLWWPQIVLDLAIFSYLVFLRLEAQRRQDRLDRRRARAAVRMRMPEDRTERLVRRQTEYQGQVAAATEHQAIAIDDDDPSFAEIPTWQPAAPSAPAVDEATYWSSRKAV